MLCFYVEGSRYIVKTDHRSLKWFLDVKESAGRIARWRLRLMEFDFEVQHRPGWKLMAAHALYWLSTNQTDDYEFNEDLAAYAVAGLHKNTDEHGMERQKLLTIQQFVPAQQDDVHIRHLAEKADAPDSPFIYNDFGIL